MRHTKSAKHLRALVTVALTAGGSQADGSSLARSAKRVGGWVLTGINLVYVR